MGTASVYLVYRLGRDAFGRPAGLLAALFLAVAPLHVAYSHMAVTDVTAVAFSLLALVLLQRAAGRAPDADAAPTGPARPGAASLAAERPRRPLARARRARRRARDVDQVQPRHARAAGDRRRRVRLPPEAARRVAAGGRAVLVWLRLLVLRVYLPMARRVRRRVALRRCSTRRTSSGTSAGRARSWTGAGSGFEHVGNGFWYNVTPNLTGAIGVVLVVLGVAGLAWAFWRRTRLDLMVAPYVVVYFLYIGTWKELADRYLLPIVPLLILLGGARLRRRRRASPRPRVRRVALPAVVVVLAVAFVLPLAGVDRVRPRR